MKTEAKRRVAELRAKVIVPDLDRLPASTLLDTRQVSLVSGFSEYTLRLWRMKNEGKGPRVTNVEGRPRYFVRDVRAWMNASGTEAA